MRIDEHLMAVPAVLTNLSAGDGSGYASLARIRQPSGRVLG